MTTRRSRDTARRGFALPAAIMALVLLSALVAGALGTALLWRPARPGEAVVSHGERGEATGSPVDPHLPESAYGSAGEQGSDPAHRPPA